VNDPLRPESAGRSGGVLLLYRDLWRLAHGQRRTLLGAISLLIGAQAILLAVPYVSGRAINTLQLEGAAGLKSAGVLLSMALLITACSWLLHGPGRVLERNVALTIRRRVSTLLVERLLVLPMSWHEAHHSGATAHRVQQSSNALSAFGQSQFIYINSTVRLIGPIIALWWIHPLVSIAAFIGFTIISASVIGFDRAMLRLARVENDAERRYSATLVDVLGNSTTLYALRQARGVTELIQRRLLAVFEPLKRTIVLNEAKWCTVDLCSRAMSCTLVALFAWLVTRQTGAASATQGALMLGSLYMVWEYAQQAGGVIVSIAQHFQNFARQHADYGSADVIHDAVPGHFAQQSPNPLAANASWQRLNIHELTFRHSANRNDAPTLDHVSLSLRRGKRYALVGSSGSGKSTMLRMLAGLYTPDRMALNRDDGPGIFNTTEAACFLRAHATLIPQDAEIFEGTLAENLGLCESVTGAPSAQQFPQALALSRACDFISSTPEALQSVVAERAANWSGGQRARIALARGILAAEGSSLVLLDEPTAHLDPVTEARVYANLFETFREACVVSSVHRLNLLEQFDEVLLMQNGRLIAQGPLDMLTLCCPEFQQLMATQGQFAADPDVKELSSAVA